MIPRDETMGVCKRLSELRNFVYWSPKCICHVYSRSYMTEKSRENQKVYLFLQESKLDKLLLCKLFMLTKKIWGFLCRIFFFFLKSTTFFLSRSKRAACVCVTQQLTTSEGLALKPCNVSNCFPAIIPPSSLTQLPVTSADKGHTMEGYFLCRHTRTYTHVLTPHAHTHTNVDAHAEGRYNSSYGC